MTAAPAVKPPSPALWSAAGGEPFLLMDSFRTRRGDEECPAPDWGALGRLGFAPDLEGTPKEQRRRESGLPPLRPEGPKRLGAGLLFSLAVHLAVLLFFILLGSMPAAFSPEGGDGPTVFLVGLGGPGGGAGGETGTPAGGPGPAPGAAEKSDAPTAPEPAIAEPAQEESAPIPLAQPAPEPVPQAASVVVEPEKIPIKPLTPPPPKPKPVENKTERRVRRETAAKPPPRKPASPPAATREPTAQLVGAALGTTGAGSPGAGGVSGSEGAGASGLGSGQGNGGGEKGDGGGNGGGGEGYAKGNYEYIRKRIQKHLVYPPQARVSFVIDREGRAKNIRITGSSGYEYIDQAVVEAVENASPFPAPPEPARITIPIGLKLK